MGDRSSSAGVRNIRAMFEAKAEDTSPPSRGRSPVGSEFSGPGSRPISKVRTSFVAVDRSGHFGTMLSQSPGPRTPIVSADARLDSTGPGDSAQALAGVKEEEMNNNSTIGRTPQYGEGPADLGTVLKGSPFETAAKSSPNGFAQPHTTSPAKSTSVRAAAKAIGEAAKAASLKPTVQKPSAISTKTAQASKDVSGPQSAKSTKSEKASKTPTTPKATTLKATSRQPVHHVSSPKPPAGAKETGNTSVSSKASVRKTSRLSTAPEAQGKSNLTAPTATSAARTVSIAKPSMSTSGQAKKSTSQNGGAKSPTKPTKLPSAATASTAASSAKGQVSRSPSRASNVVADRQTSLAARAGPRQSGVGIKPKASRASLAPSTVTTNDRSSSRASTGAKPASEGFLERMTRPTQASANKSHDKIEVKSPPRGNRVISKPKRKSEADPGKTGVGGNGEDQGSNKGDPSDKSKLIQPRFGTPDPQMPTRGEGQIANNNVKAPEPLELTGGQQSGINKNEALELTPNAEVTAAVPETQAPEKTDAHILIGAATGLSENSIDLGSSAETTVDTIATGAKGEARISPEPVNV